METENNQIVKTGDWVLTLFICAIPLIGIIMLFVWAFSGGTNPSKANWAKASLIWLVIGISLAIFFFVLFGAALSRVFS
jgi:cell division protein FtsW (lipid II flippase)